MSRITITDGTRNMRVSPEVAASHVLKGGWSIADDDASAEAWSEYCRNRDIPGAPIQARLPEGYSIRHQGPWHTVLDRAGEKVGKAQRNRADAIQLAADHAAEQEE